MKKWRHKRFCTCRYIINELKLPVQKRRLAIHLNEHGFFREKVPKTMRLNEKELSKWKTWVDKYVDKPPAWWLNLSAAETAVIQVAGEHFSVEWAHAPKDERMEYWRKLQAAIPAYRMYRIRTDREIPIVRLKRREAVRISEWESKPLA